MEDNHKEHTEDQEKTILGNIVKYGYRLALPKAYDCSPSFAHNAASFNHLEINKNIPQMRKKYNLIAHN